MEDEGEDAKARPAIYYAALLQTSDSSTSRPVGGVLSSPVVVYPLLGVSLGLLAVTAWCIMNGRSAVQHVDHSTGTRRKDGRELVSIVEAAVDDGDFDSSSGTDDETFMGFKKGRAKG